MKNKKFYLLKLFEKGNFYIFNLINQIRSVKFVNWWMLI